MGFGDWFGGLSDYASKLFGSGGGYTPPSNLDVPVMEAQPIQFEAPNMGDAVPSYNFGSVGGNVASGVGDYNRSAIDAVSTTPEVGSAGGGFWDSVGKGFSGLSNFAKGLSPVLGLGSQVLGGVAAFQAANQSGKASDRADQAAARQAEAQKAQMAAAEPLTTFGKSELEQATAGNIGPAAQARIQNWIQGARQQVNDFLARSGQGNSSALAMWESWIQQQAKEMEASELQRMKSGGIQATSAGGQILGSAGAGANQAAAAAGQDEQAINNLIASANQQLARLSSGAAA